MRGILCLALFSTLLGCCLGLVPLCPSGYNLYKPENVCIGVNVASNTKAQVEEVCSNAQAVLVSPHKDGGKQAFILEKLGDDSASFWIGVEKGLSEFEYSDGNPLDTYAPWNTLPANANPGDNCVYSFKHSGTGKFEWLITSCESTSNVACEVSPTMYVATCDPGWSKAPDGMYCLKAFRKKRDQTSAEAYCSKHGSNLAKRVQTYRQRHHAKKLAKKMYNYPFWTGVRGPLAGEYYAGDATPLAHPLPFRRQKNIGSTTCVGIRKGRWIRKNCNAKIFLLCGKEPTFTLPAP